MHILICLILVGDRDFFFFLARLTYFRVSGCKLHCYPLCKSKSFLVCRPMFVCLFYLLEMSLDNLSQHPFHSEFLVTSLDVRDLFDIVCLLFCLSPLSSSPFSFILLLHHTHSVFYYCNVKVNIIILSFSD